MYILIRTIMEHDGFTLSIDSLNGNILIDDVEYIRDIISEYMGDSGFYYGFGKEYVDKLNFDHFLNEDNLYSMTTSPNAIEQRCYVIKIKETYEKDITYVGVLSSLNYNVITERIKTELRDRTLNQLI